MKRIFYVTVVLAMFSLTLGCQNAKTKAVEGAVIGGVIGAGAGGIIGHQGHHGAEGAGIGAAVGALAGGLIGAQMEKNPSGSSSGQAAPAQSSGASQMTTQQIVDLTKQGVNEAVIIDKIKLTNSKFSLSESDISGLKSQGVSQKVIDAMQGKG